MAGSSGSETSIEDQIEVASGVCEEMTRTTRGHAHF